MRTAGTYARLAAGLTCLAAQGAAQCSAAQTGSLAGGTLPVPNLAIAQWCSGSQRISSRTSRQQRLSGIEVPTCTQSKYLFLPLPPLQSLSYYSLHSHDHTPNSTRQHPTFAIFAPRHYPDRQTRSRRLSRSRAAHRDGLTHAPASQHLPRRPASTLTRAPP